MGQEILPNMLPGSTWDNWILRKDNKTLNPDVLPERLRHKMFFGGDAKMHNPLHRKSIHVSQYTDHRILNLDIF